MLSGMCAATMIRTTGQLADIDEALLYETRRSGGDQARLRRTPEE